MLTSTTWICNSGIIYSYKFIYLFILKCWKYVMECFLHPRMECQKVSIKCHKLPWLRRACSLLVVLCSFLKAITSGLNLLLFNHCIIVQHLCYLGCKCSLIVSLDNVAFLCEWKVVLVWPFLLWGYVNFFNV